MGSLCGKVFIVIGDDYRKLLRSGRCMVQRDQLIARPASRSVMSSAQSPEFG
jgi:hypothetical protein